MRFEGRKTVRILKRAQILVADLWACFDGLDYGEFYDIDKITMFADYRIPQILNSLGCMQYSPLLETTLRKKKLIETGHSWEVQIRGMFGRYVRYDRAVSNNMQAAVFGVLSSSGKRFSGGILARK